MWVLTELSETVSSHHSFCRHSIYSENCQPSCGLWVSSTLPGARKQGNGLWEVPWLSRTQGSSPLWVPLIRGALWFWSNPAVVDRKDGGGGIKKEEYNETWCVWIYFSRATQIWWPWPGDQVSYRLTDKLRGTSDGESNGRAAQDNSIKSLTADLNKDGYGWKSLFLPLHKHQTYNYREAHSPNMAAQPSFCSQWDSNKQEVQNHSTLLKHFRIHPHEWQVY